MFIKNILKWEKVYQVLGTAISAYSFLNTGLAFAWPSSTFIVFSSPNTTLDRAMNESELSLYGSALTIGALIITPVMGYLLDVVGRKNCALLTAFAHVTAWLLLSVCSQVAVVIVATVIAGFGAATFMVLPVYIVEMCQESIRGSMTAAAMIFYCFGMMISYLLGGCLPYLSMVYVSLVMAMVEFTLIMVLNESPLYLLQKGYEEDATQSLAFYRNSPPNSMKVQSEMEILRRALNPELDSDERASLTNHFMFIEEYEYGTFPGTSKDSFNWDPSKQEKLSLWKFLKKSRSTRRAIFVNITMVTLGTFQGLFVVQVYAIPLFTETVPEMSPVIGSVVMGAISVAAGLVAAYFTDVVGRKPLIVFSSIGAGIACIGLGTQLQYRWAPNWVGALFIYLFCTMYVFGGGTVPYVLAAEIFLPEVKSFMSMFVNEWSWVCSFILLFTYNPLVSFIGLGPVFYVYSAVCFCTSAFCYMFQPETKGQPVNAIQLLFLRKGLSLWR